VVKALTCIRDQAGIPLAVNEVARKGGHFAPRLRPFPAATGRLSILKEIRRQRADQIARLLLETSLPVARVAESLGLRTRSILRDIFVLPKNESAGFPQNRRRAVG
jgi:AraC-like DNA-binding protein